MPHRNAKSVLLVLHAAALLVALVLLLWPDAARGDDDIHKCRGDDDGVVYQDAPCPPGTALLAPTIARDAGRATPVASPGAAASPVATTAGVAVAGRDAARPPAPPLRARYRCERYDGQERYVTDDPQPRRYQVPLWTLVGEAGAAGGAYTWVEDRCTPMSLREQCADWRARRGEVAARRRLAFSGELAQLDGELESLRANLAAHCGR